MVVLLLLINEPEIKSIVERPKLAHFVMMIKEKIEECSYY